MLLQSGTNAQVTAGQADYTVVNTNNVKFGFALERDDVVATAVVTSGSSGSGSGGAPTAAPYITFGASGGLSNERILTSGVGIEVDSSVANQIRLNSDRQKVSYEITGSHPSGTKLTIPSVNFAAGQYKDKHIDIFINGMLMTSGSNEDYTLFGDANNIMVNFALSADDKVTVLIQ